MDSGVGFNDHKSLPAAHGHHEQGEGSHPLPPPSWSRRI